MKTANSDINLTALLERLAKHNPELKKALRRATVFENAGFGADWERAPADVWRKAGISPADVSISACPKCAGQGAYLAVDARDPARRLWMYCDCDAGRVLQYEVFARRHKDYLTPDLPAKYAEFSFTSWQSIPASQRVGKELAYAASLMFAERWQSNHWLRLDEVYAQIGMTPPSGVDLSVARNSIVLYGAFGVGKTGLMCAIIQYLARARPALYRRVRSLIQDIQNTYDDRKGEREPDDARPTREQLMTLFTRAPILALDEFTLEIISPDRKEILETIVRSRCERDLPMIITTNSTPGDFARQWDGRISDVLLESAHWVPMGGPNLRRKSQIPPQTVNE